MKSMKNKILGALIGAAAGDAMGAAAEGKSEKGILEEFGEKITDFKKPPKDTPAGACGREKGQITDAFSIAYFLINNLAKNDGRATRQAGEETLKEWGSSEYFKPFAGMTTRVAVHELNNDENNDAWFKLGHKCQLYKGHYYAYSTNGAACKAFPAGLINPGNIENAISDTVELTMASHDDPFSISGACAAAAAVSECFNDNSSIFSVMQAGIYGADKGEQLGRKRTDVWVYPGPSVYKRMLLSQKIAVRNVSSEDVLKNLRDYIGCGPEIAETVPAAFGIIAANKQNPLNALYDAVNIGDETSAIASIVGAITGAYYGKDVFPQEYQKLLEEKNNINFSETAKKIKIMANYRI